MIRFVERHAGALQVAFVIGIVGLALLLSISLRPDAPSQRPVATSGEQVVSTVTPVAAPYQPSVRLSGVVEARTVTSIIPQVAGRVVSVSSSFRPGASVARGEVLFRIDPADYRLAVERTLAEIEVARSDLARLEAEAAAEREIWQNQFPDRQIPDLIARIPQIAAAKARIKSGEAARQAAELSLARTTVRAPFDARILDTQLDVGQVVSGSAAVGNMFSVDSIEIGVPVSAEERKLIGPLNGQTVTVIPPGATDAAIPGRLLRVSAALDERTRLGTLFVGTDKPEALTVGEFVEVQINGADAPDAYRLPAAALTSRDQLWVVVDGRLKSRTVDVIGTEDELAVIRVFDDADGVVVVPPANARDGLPVTGRVSSGVATVKNRTD
mgnify:CR=1 FL=1